MISKKTLVAICLFVFSLNLARSQDIEAGIMVGPSNYSGDLTADRLTFSETQPAAGLLFRYYFSPKFNLKASLSYARVSGDDENYDDINFREKRNLSFKSNIFEASIQGEYNILPYISNTKEYNWSPYVFGGVALYRFNPKADFQGSTVDLADFTTEGEDYSLTQLAIPFGVGIKYSIGNRWNIGLEIGARKLFTDYLDDVSDEYVQLSGQAADIADRSDELVQFNQEQFSPGNTRGNSSNKDWYGIAGFTITKTFRSSGCTKDFY